MSRFARQSVVAGGVLLLALAGAPAAAAETTVTEGAMTLTVSQSENLPLEGGVLTVTGSGFDESKGIYVAVCVDNGPGELPTPCIGGVDMEGDGGGSGWISSNPPEYATGLPTPFEPGGSFQVEMTVAAVDPVSGTDCTQVSCVVATRADHTRLQDRSLDLKIPLTFSADGVLTAPTSPSTGGDASTRSVPSVPSTSAPDATDTSVPSDSVGAPTSPDPSSAAPSSVSSSPAVEETSVTSDVVENTDPEAGDPVETEQGSALWWVVGGVALLVAVVAGVVVARRRGGRTEEERS